MADKKSPPPRRAPGWPEGENDVVNQYGTYEIQPTCDAQNPYPMIAQGISPAQAEEQKRAAARWRKKPGGK